MSGIVVNLFYSYSHKDEQLRNKLDDHLSILKRQGVLSEWYDRRITAGEEWAAAIDSRLDSAAIILLLVSPAFLASDYCYDVELKHAMERHELGYAHVIPVILRPVDWTGAPFSKLQALPTNARPVTTWRDRDEAFKDIAKGIRKAIDKICSSPRIKVQEVGDVTIVEFLDSELLFDLKIGMLRERIYDLLDHGASKVVLDFRNVEFISSAGFGMVVLVYKRALTKKGKIKCCCVSSKIMSDFQITRLDKVISFYGTLKEALKSFDCFP